MRARDPTFHNVVANHPDVIRNLEWSPEEHPETDGLMLFGHLADDDRYFLMHAGDRDFTAVDMVDPKVELPGLALVFEWSAPGVYQVHTMSHPDRRANVVAEAKALIHEMLTVHGADMVWGQTPLHNIPARKFNQKIGAKTLGQGHHFIAGDVEYFGGRKAEWLRDHWDNPAG